MQTTTTLLTLLLASTVGQRTPSDSPSVAELQAHYARVEVELRSAETGHLTPTQRTARTRAIEVLRAYRERGEFGRSPFAEGRWFQFVDPGGRRCAVAELLHATGHDTLVEAVAQDRNDALVSELCENAELLSWLEVNGLSLQEAARIQGPGNPSNLSGGSTADRGPASSGQGQRRWGPADTVGGSSTGGGDGTSTAPPSSSDPVTGAVSPGSSATPPGGNVVAQASHEVGPESWWTWWDLHKLDYLRPNLIRNWVATVTGFSREDGFPARQLELVRQELLPIALRDLREGDPDVRAAAALAVGRMAGDGAVEPLTAALDDSSLFVRERALLSLGATGSDRAAAVLLDVARTGAIADRVERVCPDARFLAIVALGIGRRNGMDAKIDVEIARLTKDIPRSQRTAVQTALAGYQTLNPTASLQGWCYEHAADDDLAHFARCRALEALRFQVGDLPLQRLQRGLSDRSLEVRRSSALALGEVDHELALQPLLTAAEVEKEPLARAFVLLSVGRQGGDDAKSFLLDRLRNGRKTDRAWCALALGILARETDDADVRRELRERFESERNRAVRGAWYLALGLARDDRAVPILHEAAIKGFSPETRAAAIFGLAMIGTGDARDILLERLVADPCPFTRSQIAQSIGFLGDPRDADILLRTLRDQAGPDYLSTVALALGLHGSRAALEGLVEVVKDDRATPASRAAALEAVQLLIGRGPSLTMAELLRQTNYAVFPPPIVRHLDIPL